MAARKKNTKISKKSMTKQNKIDYLCVGLDPSGYRSSIAHKDENDALLGGETEMSDEERFKVCFFLTVHFMSSGESVYVHEIRTNAGILKLLIVPHLFRASFH